MDPHHPHRSNRIHLAASFPVGDPRRRAILATLRQAGDVPPVVADLMASLRQVPGVSGVYITDYNYPDGYFHLRVRLALHEGPNALGGWSQKVITFNYSRGRSGDFYNIKDYPKVLSAIRRTVERAADVTVDSIEGPQKFYEYQDLWDKRQRTPKLSGYDGQEVSVEIYV